MRPISINLQRVLGALVLGGAFVVMASIFSPDRSQAELDSPRNNSHKQSTAKNPSTTARGALSAKSSANPAHAALGCFETADYTVEIWSGTIEPLYTIKDSRTGETLASFLSADEVNERFPDLDLARINNDASDNARSHDQLIMIAEPEKSPADWDTR